MGCDRGVHIKDDEYYKKGAFQIASIIADFAKDKAFDIIFTGMQSQDRGSGQVGILVGEMLNIASVSTIIDLRCQPITTCLIVRLKFLPDLEELIFPPD